MTEPPAPAEPADDPSVAGPVRRAGTLQAVGSVAAIAVLVTAGLVVWMRSAAPAAVEPPDSGVETEVPTTLAGGMAPGEVPPDIAAAVDDPVVAAVVLDERPADVGDCGFGEVVDPQFERGYALPGAVVISNVGEVNEEMFGPMGGEPMPVEPMEPPVLEETQVVEATPMPGPTPVPGVTPDPAITPGPPPMPTPEPPPAPPPGAFPQAGMRWRETCLLREVDGGGWVNDLSISGPAGDSGGHGAAMTCCSGGMATAMSDVRVPDEVAWVLQDRGVYWLAYEVEETRTLPITWRYPDGGFRGPGRHSTHVLLLDPAGEVVEERFIDG